MAYPKDRVNAAKSLVGKRIEIPIHYDAWMRGARCGIVASLKWRPSFNGDGREVCGVKVRLDHPQYRTLKTIWMIDIDYVKVLA